MYLNLVYGMGRMQRDVVAIQAGSILCSQMGLSRPAEKLPNSYGLACELFSVLGGNSSTECISRITPSEAIFDGGAPRVSKDSEKGYLKYAHYRGLPLGLRLPAGNRDSDWSWRSQTG